MVDINISSSTLLLLAVLLIPTAYLILDLSTSRRSSLPPGPPSSLLFGTRFQTRFIWRQFEKWTEEYGEVFTVYPGGRLWTKPLIVVGTFEASKELMEKDSARTADRPINIFANEYLSGGMRILLVRQSERWKRLRKMLHQGLQPKMAATFEPIQEKAATRFINDLLESPEDFATHAKSYAASVIMTVTYNKQTPTRATDPDVKAVEVGQGRLGRSLRPGAYAVDSLHLLRHLPGAWKAQGRQWHKEELELFSGQLNKVRKDLKEGRENESFGRFIIEHQKEYKLSDNEAAYLAGSLFGAGSHTTAAALAVTIMACTLNPKVVARAQKELDQVVGRERLPNWNDQSDLPFIQAFVKEVMRWRPISSGGFAHATTTDMSYKTYVIPSGSSIVGNHWSISRDPKVFPDPDRFEPARWFVEGSNETQLKKEKDVDHVAYGFGRRVCAGRHVADRSIYINSAFLLWAFTFSKKKDADGKDIEIDTLAFTNEVNSHPLPFSSDIRPRFEGVEKLVKEAMMAA